MADAIGPGDRKVLEDVLRGQLAEAYLTGLAGAVLPRGATFGYPGEAGAVAVVMAAVEACTGGSAEAEEEYLAPAEAARILRVTTETLVRWEKEGRLTALRNDRGHRLYARSSAEALHREREGRAGRGGAR